MLNVMCQSRKVQPVCNKKRNLFYYVFVTPCCECFVAVVLYYFTLTLLVLEYCKKRYTIKKKYL